MLWFFSSISMFCKLTDAEETKLVIKFFIINGVKSFFGSLKVQRTKNVFCEEDYENVTRD
jgi:hypothetical protein